MRIASIAVLCLGLTACFPDTVVNRDELTDYKVEWRELADGSHFGETGGSGEFATVLRCWDGQADYSGRKQCLAATKHYTTGSVKLAQVTFDELPATALLSGSTTDGYGCGSLMGSYEEIVQGGEPLVINRAVPWSPRFVLSYMTENEVSGSSWFECLPTLRSINQGSLATMGTSSITREMAGAI